MDAPNVHIKAGLDVPKKRPDQDIFAALSVSRTTVNRFWWRWQQAVLESGRHHANRAVIAPIARGADAMAKQMRTQYTRAPVRLVDRSRRGCASPSESERRPHDFEPDDHQGGIGHENRPCQHDRPTRQGIQDRHTYRLQIRSSHRSNPIAPQPEPVGVSTTTIAIFHNTVTRHRPLGGRPPLLGGLLQSSERPTRINITHPSLNKRAKPTNAAQPPTCRHGTWRCFRSSRPRARSR